VQKIEPLAPARHHVHFTASTELRDKIERAIELMRHTNPTGDLAVAVNSAFDALLEKLAKKKLGETTRPRKAKPPIEGAPEPEKRSRHVSHEVRRAVHARDGEQCAYVDPHGNRCPSRSFLQLEHVHPWAKGGESDEANVRYFCAPHNARAAEREFGRAFMEAVKAVKNMRQRKSAKAAAPPSSRGEAPEAEKLFETAKRALCGMGFRPNETVRALDQLRGMRDTSAPLPSIELLLREALAILTDGLATQTRA
jgi:hypothetical protein